MHISRLSTLSTLSIYVEYTLNGTNVMPALLCKYSGTIRKYYFFSKKRYPTRFNHVWLDAIFTGSDRLDHAVASNFSTDNKRNPLVEV
jgi:hypothetical protein